MSDNTSRPFGERLRALSRSPLRFAPFLLALLSLTAVVVEMQPSNARVADEYFVQMTGDDANNGSAAKPWRTIQKAVDSAERGTTILIGSGHYEPFVVTRPDLTIAAQDGAVVTIRGNAQSRDVVLLASDNLTLSNLTVEGCVPNAQPDGFEDFGSSGVRVDDDTRGATIYRVEVRDGRGSTPTGKPIGCFGVFVHNARNVTVEQSRIQRNGYGVYVRGSESVRIIDNQIINNDRVIRNTSYSPNDDFGAVGIGFDNAKNSVAQGNTISDNAGPSIDYGVDGGAFEIFQSSGITMTRNILANNQTILETGTKPGGECLDNKFTDNEATAMAPQRPRRGAGGMILRCATNMLIANNTFRDADRWTFQFTTGDPFSGGVSGVDIVGNTVTQGSAPIYVLDLNPAGRDLAINDNRYTYSVPFARWEGTTVDTFDRWRKLTGFDASSPMPPKPGAG